ncbi:MAG: hypothetical protein HN413_15520 [Chloroflexi bacterium]|jgi:DNA-binding NarL/FixJ family response regulator|nr:hypothetical protein [Chloroflexota bacterium]
MMRKQVVILSKHSLFSQGVASRFEQFPERVAFHFIDPQEQEYIEQIVKLQPSAVVLNSSEVDWNRRCLLCALLSAIREITIIRLSVDERPVQVIRSQQSQLDEVRDLLDLLS